MPNGLYGRMAARPLVARRESVTAVSSKLTVALTFPFGDAISYDFARRGWLMAKATRQDEGIVRVVIAYVLLVGKKPGDRTLVILFAFSVLQNKLDKRRGVLEGMRMVADVRFVNYFKDTTEFLVTFLCK